MASSRGPIHAVNEDSHSPIDGAPTLFVVADGVGGGASASYVSKELVSRLHRALAGRRHDAEAVRAALLDADRAIASTLASRTDECGAATVALCARTGASPSHWLIAWVGDCRIYRVPAMERIGDAEAELLTVDDTYRNLGETPPPGGSLDDPSRMVGNGAVDAPNVRFVKLGAGEMLVLCSDGVHKHADAREIVRSLAEPLPLARRCINLIEHARTRGSHDDATVLVVQREDRGIGRLARVMAISVLLALLALIAVFLVGDRAAAQQRAARCLFTVWGATMTPEQIERVFGCSRLKMATGEHVEVFREAVRPGERRRYTKRFLETGDADFRQWTEREWRILARLIGHGIRCVPGVVRYDGGVEGGMRQVQTYDAGVTVDQWATLLPVARSGAVLRHVFEDCAHWWALAHHCIAALEEIHALQLVHLDIKADNICIPYAPTNFDPDAVGRHSSARHIHPTSAHRFRVLSRVARKPGHGIAHRLAEGLRLPVAAPPHRPRGRSRRRPSAYTGARLALRPLQPGGDAEALPSRRSAGRRRWRGTGLDREALRQRPGADLPAARLSRW